MDLNEPSTISAEKEIGLDDRTSFTIAGTPEGASFPRWMPIEHCNDKRNSLILISGETLAISLRLIIEPRTRLFMRFGAGLPSISPDGLTMDLIFDAEIGEQEDKRNIATFALPGGDQSPQWREIDMSLNFLKGLTGRFSVMCCPGPNNDPTADWLALADLCIGREDKISLLKARSFPQIRSMNEIHHFSWVYRHNMYSEMQDRRAKIAGGEVRPIRALPKFHGAGKEHQGLMLKILDPQPNESPYAYGSRLLYNNIPNPRYDFARRLRERAEGSKKIKVLSLCSGAARIESDFASKAGPNVEWSLLDINQDLLGLASKQFSPELRLDLIEGNANDLEFSGEKWDVIMCVSAIHHIVELEKFIKFCHDSLNPGGEFWSIGEYVGMNGNRLWPEAYEVANALFRSLPERLRLNRMTGHVDVDIPDNDYSVGCYEGIRSEDIEMTLSKWFTPLDVYRRNCFLWRLLNLAYSDNYNIDNDEDRRIIIGLAEAELNHYLEGGRGTELFGVYLPKSQ